MDEETAVLIDMLRATRRTQMRESLVRQLAERADPDAASTLMELLDAAADPRAVPIVTAALAGLQHLGRAAGPVMFGTLAEPPNAKRPFVPLLLASAFGEDALPQLIAALHDAQRGVRINAATQLGMLRAPAAFDPLLALLRDERDDPEVRAAAAAALGALRDARALPILAALSTTGTAELLAGAIDGLADLRDPAGIPFLEAVLDRSDLDERTTRAVRLALLAMERYRT
jgi:HEAT repeat protein